MAQGYTGDTAIRPLEKLMTGFAAPRGYDIDKVFTGLLDYIIWQLDPTGQPIDYWPFKEGEGVAFKDMMQCALEIIGSEANKHGWYDAFGDLFMSLHRAGNSKGQFFTPPSVCQVVAACTLKTKEEGDLTPTPFGKRITINDPTAGSSRLLLAGAMEQMKVMREEWGYDEVTAYARRPYLSAEDIDFNCVKISAINIAIHGYFGEAVCHDTLCNPGDVCLGYMINEGMWPFPSGMPTIRKEMNPMRFVSTRLWLKKEQVKEQQTTDRPTIATAAYHSGSESALAPVSERKSEPIQLSLW